MSRANGPIDVADTWELRAPERALLAWCVVCIALGFVMLWGSTYVGGGMVDGLDLLPLGLYTLSLLTLHLMLVTARFRGDQLILVAVAFLSGFGMLAQYRMGSFETEGTISLNLLLFPIGLILMGATAIILMRGRYQALGLAHWIWVWAGLSLGLLAVLLLFGQRFRGGVYAAGLVTPSEILKVTIVLFVAGFIARNAKSLGAWGKGLPLPPWRALLPLAGFWLVLAGLLVIQHDLGLVIILSIALLTMLVVGTGRMGYLVFGGIGAVAMAAAVLKVLPHGERRVTAWLEPFRDPTGGSWQILQGLSGMFSGGLWGEGFGRGSPEYTPIAQSDFIYSVIGEELGFAGCAIVILFFLILFGRSLLVASRAADSYGRSVGTGLLTVLATQTFLNIGGITKFVPLTGLPLPFISHGGSSLITGFIGVGILLAISDGQPTTASRNRIAKQTNEITGKGVRRSRRASAG
ncbi:FtsW/RodA/SpoVE family cell cycle protein [Thiocapsa roseopersicina]|uniref:Cell elongation-specific peptidoglycan biosynthesis regulator RodA n=1 Tax=Thiocapsa roseopersicina TaxID=1058 RepID=A0A1H2WYA9_THIRO|nr:FtsW/RodA/SpoVE family cell cycle protein [Thiocapsa roseopersicina]SDW85592.1 cell elongation-specific peptidoglycan biosynthesis regulator RodA [Thiocapsa roseopersicina]